MGEKGLEWGMTPEHLKEIRRLEKQNQQAKQLLAEQHLGGKLEDEPAKKEVPPARGKNRSGSSSRRGCSAKLL